MKNRRVLLVALDWTRSKDPPLSLGHASIVANLVQNKIDVLSQSWSVNRPDFSTNEVVESIMALDNGNTDVAFGAFAWNEASLQTILNELKKREFTGRIIVGGPQVSYVTEGLEGYYPQANIYVRGYGEAALAELYQSTESNPDIPGIVYRGGKDSGISANVTLGDLPSPYLNGLIAPQRFLRIESQRGCPFRCSFCQYPEAGVTKTRRDLSLQRLEAEMEWITDNPVVQDVFFIDPVFNSGPNYLRILEKLIEGEYSGKLALECRLEMVTPDFLERVEALNQTGNVVLQFGVQTIHNNEGKAIQRGNNKAKMRQALEWTRDRDIETEVSLIFGLPEQTVDSFRQSVAFCQEMGVTRIHAFPLMLLRGTPLHQQKEELGLVESNEVDFPDIPRISEGIIHVVQSPSFTTDDWMTMARIAEDLEKRNMNMGDVDPAFAYSNRISGKANKSNLHPITR